MHTEIKLFETVKEMENQNILKEEVDIKEEVYTDLTIHTVESKITSDCSLPEASPLNIYHSNSIAQEFPSEQAIDETSNDTNVCIGIDNSLQLNPVKGTFSLEIIGSKTLVVFRRLLQDQDQDQESKAANEEVTECPCSKCESVFSSYELLSNHITEVHNLDEVRRKILEGRYIKICSKCSCLTKSNSVVNCVSCSAEFHYKCQQCSQTFDSYEKLSNHLLNQCSPEGYYHCPQCDHKSVFFNYVHRHVLKKHPDLGSNFDLRSIEWKDIAKGSKLTCSKCNRKYTDLRTLNKHISYCKKKVRVIDVSSLDIGSGFEADGGFLQVNGRRIVLHCIKCNKNVKFCHFVRRQPSCTTCKLLLAFKCTLCDKLMTHNFHVRMHLKSICIPRQKPYSCRNLSVHEEQHERTLNRVGELRSGQRSPCPTGDFEQSGVFSDKSINRLDMTENILPITQEKPSSILFASQKYDTIFAEKFDLAKQPKYCDKKLQMQCKVLLTPLKINKL